MFKWFDVMIRLSFMQKKPQKLCLIFKKNVNIKNDQFKISSKFSFFSVKSWTRQVLPVR